MNKKHAYAGGLIASSLLISFLLCESVLRIFPPEWLQYRMTLLNPDANTASFGTDRAWKVERQDGKFWRFEPGSKFDVSHVEYSNVAHIDDLGGRRVVNSGEPKSQVKDPVAPFLGDSFTFGVGVEDEETFTSLLSGKLGPVRILNLGVPGTALNSQIRIISLRHVELGHPSRYVLFFFLGNDFADILHAARREEARDKQKAIAQTRAHKTSHDLFWHINAFVYHNAILKRSYLNQFLRKFALDTYNAVFKRRGKDEIVSAIFLLLNPDNERYYAEAKQALTTQLERLKAMEKELDFSVLLVAIPDLYQIDDTSRKLLASYYGFNFARLEPHRPNRLLEIAAAKVGLPVFDSSRCLSSSGLGAKLYYTQDNHLRAIGHEVFADCIEQRLKRFFQD